MTFKEMADQLRFIPFTVTSGDGNNWNSEMFGETGHGETPEEALFSVLVVFAERERVSRYITSWEKARAEAEAAGDEKAAAYAAERVNRARV